MQQGATSFSLLLFISFLPFPLALSLVVEGRFGGITDGCLCGYECFSGLYISVMSQFGLFFFFLLLPFFFFLFSLQ